ncbi:MAG: efflux RND transporter periplasmic adaptor subunit [Bacteroidetes bacterium]|nr:MAG: efflux RND transporter periplasmic adaptor subunit [Bacteroidota bacterium]
MIIFTFVSLFFLACGTKKEKKEIVQKFCLTDTLKKNITLATSEKRIVENEIVLSGKITFDEDKIAKVYPLAGGFVQELRANLGDYVQKGQVLAVIRSPEIAGFTSQSSISLSALKVAEKNYKINQDLYKTGTISEVELTNSKKDLETAQSEVNRMQEMLSMYNVGKASFYQIKAPASGFVVSKDISLNMELRTEDIKPIFTISNMENVWVLANIYESDIEDVKEGFEANVTTIAYKDENIQGKVDKIFQLLDPESKVLKAKITLNNKGYKLKPDMYAKVIVRNPNSSQTKIAVPSKALIFEQNRYFLVVYKNDCDLEVREVVVHKETQMYAYIESGINEGEKVLTKYQLLAFKALNN